MQIAQAAGTPTQLIVFTDKKVYFDAGINPRATAADGFHPDPSWVETEDLRAITYAIVLDDDGNIVHGTNGSITATINDIKILSHENAASRNTTTHHSNIIDNPNYVYGSVSGFNDNGVTYDNNANDGINSAIMDIPDFTFADPFTWNGSSFAYSDAHILLQINVTYTGSVTLTGNVTIMISPNTCHQGDKDSHADFNAHHADENAGMMTCTNCHWGYDHLYNGDKFSEIPPEFDDVHINKIVFPSGLNALAFSPSGVGFEYNSSYDETVAWSTWGTYEPKEFNASKYCYVCHYGSNGGGLLEYGGVEIAKRGNLSDRPSCSVASKSLGVGTVTCHDVTNITGNSIIAWSPSIATADITTNNLLNATNAVSHNHSTSKQANVSCALCHGTVHNYKLPNSSATGAAYLEINNQCPLCHNISGGLNITSNGITGGEGSLHVGKTDCKSCHFSPSNSKLDSHLVPVGVSGGMNCTSCHDIGGSAGYDVNFTAINRSMHANLNNRSTFTGGNATNKPCWACHGTKNGTWANESSQPANEHNATYYKNPRECQNCHTTGIFNAKNVTDHIPSGYDAATDVNTSSYNNTYCSYCHNNSVNNGNDSFMGLSSGGSPMNASVSHYGANDTAGKLMSATNNSTDCVYCHRNTSNMAKWGIIPGSLANLSNKNGTVGTGTNHNSYTASSQCSACHGGYTVTAGFTFHNSSLGSGSSGELTANFAMT